MIILKVAKKQGLSLSLFLSLSISISISPENGVIAEFEQVIFIDYLAASLTRYSSLRFTYINPKVTGSLVTMLVALRSKKPSY